MPRKVRLVKLRSKRKVTLNLPSGKTVVGKGTVPGASIKLAMRKPKNAQDIPSIVRWIESHKDRFESEYDAFKEYQNKVCPHSRSAEIARVTKGTKVKHISSCQECGYVVVG